MASYHIGSISINLIYIVLNSKVAHIFPGLMILENLPEYVKAIDSNHS